MDVLYPRCAGRDVHKREGVACVLISQAGASEPVKRIRRFLTRTDDLQRLGEWLAEEQVRAVALESTGVYWQPVWNVLEERFHLRLVNAQHVKRVPGRKTDVQDAEWLAQLLRHGLVQASVVPPRAQRELRELTRYRSSLVHERAAAINRLQKTLEGATIKLASVASDVTGASGRAILAALVAGATDPPALADLAKGRLREQRAALVQALTGQFRAHQRFLVAQQLTHLDDLDALIVAVSDEIAARCAGRPAPTAASHSTVAADTAAPTPPKPPDSAAPTGLTSPASAPPSAQPASLTQRPLLPFAEAVTRLDAIPGIGPRTAEAIVAELGVDLTRFAPAKRLAAWAGVCPGQYESAGKRQRGTARHGNRHLRTLFVEAAHSAIRTKDTYLAAQYHRLAARRGKRRAIVAVAHSLVVIVYVLLTRHEAYRDLGAHFFEERDRQAIERQAVRRLQALGYQVSLSPSAA